MRRSRKLIRVWLRLLVDRKFTRYADADYDIADRSELRRARTLLTSEEAP